MFWKKSFILTKAAHFFYIYITTYFFFFVWNCATLPFKGFGVSKKWKIYNMHPHKQVTLQAMDDASKTSQETNVRPGFAMPEDFFKDV